MSPGSELFGLGRLRSGLLDLAIGIAVSLALWGCDGSPKDLVPDSYPVGTTVTLQYRGNELVLGPKSAQQFLEMLAKTPYRSQISTMPAAPMGVFRVDGKKYHWHGIGVIQGKHERERLWHGPLLQRLIYATSGRAKTPDFEDIRSILDQLENDPTVSKTPLEGPGAYPGGGDALHPITDIKDFKTFTPGASRGNELTPASKP